MSYARSALDNLKREISDFQKQFRKSHGRLPRPEDIKKANMAKTYREHKRLKALVGKTENLRERKLQKMKQKGVSRSATFCLGDSSSLMTPKSGSPLSSPVEVTPTFPSLGRAMSAVFVPSAISSSSSSSGFPRYRSQNRPLKSGGPPAPFSARRQNMSSRVRSSAMQNLPKRRRTVGPSPRSSMTRSLSVSGTGGPARLSASSATGRRNFTSPVRRTASNVSPNENRPPLSSNSLQQLGATASPMSRFASRHRRMAQIMVEEKESKANGKQPLTFQTEIPETPPRLDHTRSVFTRGSKPTSSHGVSKLILSPEHSNESLCATPPNISKPSIKRAQSMLMVPTRSTAFSRSSTGLSEKSKLSSSLPVEVPDSMDPPSPRLPRTKSTLTDPPTSRDRLHSPPVSRSSALSLRNENSTSRFAAVFGRTLSGTTQMADSARASSSTPVLRETSSEALMMPGQGTSGTTASLVGSTTSGNSRGPTTFDHFLKSHGESNAPKPRANPLLLNATSSSSGPLSTLGFQAGDRTQSAASRSSQLSTSSRTQSSQGQRASTLSSQDRKHKSAAQEPQSVFTARSRHVEHSVLAMSDSSNPSVNVGGDNSLPCVPGTPSPIKGRARSCLASSSSLTAVTASRSRESAPSLSQHTKVLSREPLTDISHSSVSNAAETSCPVPMSDSIEGNVKRASEARGPDTFAAFLPPSGCQSRPEDTTNSTPTPSGPEQTSAFSPASPRSTSAPYPKCKLPSGPRAPPSPGTPSHVSSSSTGGTPPCSSPTNASASPDKGAFMSPKPRSTRKFYSRASVPMSPLAQSLDFMIQSPLRGAGVPLARTLSQLSSHSRGFARATTANRLLNRTASTPLASQLFSKQTSLFPPANNSSQNPFLSKKSKPVAMSPQRVNSLVLSRADSVGAHFPHMRSVNTAAGEGHGLGECDSQCSVASEKDVEMSKEDSPTKTSTDNAVDKFVSRSSEAHTEKKCTSIPMENTTSLPPLSDDDNDSLSNDFKDIGKSQKDQEEVPVAATDAQKVARDLLSSRTSCAASKLFEAFDKKDDTQIPMSRPTLLSEAMKDTLRPRRMITPLTTPFSKSRRRRSSRSSSKRNGNGSARKQLLQGAGNDKPVNSIPDAGVVVAASTGNSPMRPLSLFSGDQNGKRDGKLDAPQDSNTADNGTKALPSQLPQLGDSSPIAKNLPRQNEIPSGRKPRRSTRKRKTPPSPSKDEGEESDFEPQAVEFDDEDGDDEGEVDEPQSDDGGESSDYAPSRRSGTKRKRPPSASSRTSEGSSPAKVTAKRRAATKGAKQRRKTVATTEDAATAEPPTPSTLRRSTRQRRRTAHTDGAFGPPSGSSSSGYSQSGYTSASSAAEHTTAPFRVRKSKRTSSPSPSSSAKKNLAVPALSLDRTLDSTEAVSGTKTSHKKSKTPKSTTSRAKKSSAAKTKKPAGTATKKKAVRAKKATVTKAAKPKAKAKPKKKSMNFKRQMTNLKKTRYQRKRQPGIQQAGRSRFHNSRRGRRFKDWSAIRTERDLYMEKRNEALYTDLLDEKELENAVNTSTTQALSKPTASSSAATPSSSSSSSNKNDSQVKSTPSSNAPASEKEKSFQSQILSEATQSSSKSLASSFQKTKARTSIYTPSCSSVVSFSSAVDASGASPEGERKTNTDFYIALQQKNFEQEQAGGSGNLDVCAILKEHFGHPRFRLGQLEAVQRTLDGRSTLLLMPTGGGKSLCYQFPALVLPGMALVVTPLLSLMQDQLQRLPPCLRGAVWNSSQNISDQNEVRKRICAKEIDVLYISPERLFSPGFQRFLQRTYIDQNGGQLAFACVDEAHCVSEWSHNFRPAFLQLNSVLRTELNIQTVLAMTATATRLTERSVCRHLAIARGNILRFDRHRSNLCLSVSRDTRDRLSALKDLLRSARFRDLESLIIYCGMKRECDAVAAALRSIQIDAHSYHGDLKRHERKEVQDKFMDGKLRIVVATISFGMGLDKQDVRGVIHFSPPRTLEHYVQEIGRAGRDGVPAQCHCFYDDRDMTRMKSLIYSDGIDEVQIFSLLISIFGDDPKALNPGHHRAICQDSIAKKCDVSPEVITTLISQVNEVANLEEAAAKRSKEKAAAERENTLSSMTDDKDSAAEENTALEKEIALLMDGVADEFAAGCTLEEEQMAANANDLLRILPDLHNVARVGFVGNMKRIAQYVKVAKYIMENIKPRSGFYRVKITDAANRMGVPLADVQAQLARMRAVSDITLEWSDKSNCIQVIKHPKFAEEDRTENAMSDDDEDDGDIFSVPSEYYETTKFAKLDPAYARSLRSLAKKISENLCERERMQLNKVNTVLQAFRLVAYPRWKDYDPTAKNNASGSSLTLAAIVEKYFQIESDEALLQEIENELSADERLVAMSPVGNASLERDITVTLKVLLGSYEEQLSTAREITRILHGIQTKRFPWKMWSKNDAWRKHASYPFADLLKFVQRFLDKRKAKSK